jgi:hypothetical protein
MTENRIRVKVEPELTPVRLEDKMDVHAEIDVGVESHLKGLGVFGAVLATVGALLIVVAAIMFAFGFPTPWYGSIDDAGHNAFVKAVVITAAAGVTFLFVGTSAFFYGRTVLGSGHLDQFATTAVDVAEPARPGGMA